MKLQCILAFLLLPFVAQAQLYPNQGNTVSVSGDAEIKVVPNQVVLSLGVETRDKSLSVARAQNDSAVRSVLDAIARFHIDPTDVQTDFIQVNIQYNNSMHTVVDYYKVCKVCWRWE